MMIVDTSVWIDDFNGTFSEETDYVDHSFGNQEILILTEILQGVQEEHLFREAQNLLENFLVVPMLGMTLTMSTDLFSQWIKESFYFIMMWVGKYMNT